MILAGVDEAGLGPTLGPLCTASVALSVPDGWKPDTPWQRLADAVAEKVTRSGALPAVADSKVLYTAGGMAALERAVGAFSLLLEDGGICFPLAPGEAGAGAVHPCYTRKIEPFPVFADLAGIRAASEQLAAALAREKAAVVHFETVQLYEPLLNHRFDTGLNKNQALLVETGRHLSRLAAKFPREEMLVVVDKQGGRNDYLPFLSALFPGAWIDTLSAGAGESAYRLRRAGANAVFRFLAKADRLSFPTALASLAAKYARERAMAELNAWFGDRLDGLAETAGYPVDAKRWLAEVEQSGKSAEWDVSLLVRKR